MMVLVVGGSGSGKSSYAEKMAVSLAQAGMRKYYLATMQVFDDEGRKKVERHRNLRSGKGFFTIEQPTRISGALEKMEDGDRTVLLECISNLTANEMFSPAGRKTKVSNIIENGLIYLAKQSLHLVVVGNNVFEDGNSYDEKTREYLQEMAKVHQFLAAHADRVVEVICGIPIEWRAV